MLCGEGPMEVVGSVWDDDDGDDKHSNTAHIRIRHGLSPRNVEAVFKYAPEWFHDETAPNA